MPSNLSFWLPFALLAVVSGGLLLWVFCLQQGLRQTREQTTRLLSELQLLTQRLEMLGKGSLGVGKRLMVAEQRLNLVSERLDELEVREPSQGSFSQAARLLEQGLDADEVSDHPGISSSEARLMELLKRRPT
jgi:hypothetical protein